MELLVLFGIILIWLKSERIKDQDEIQDLMEEKCKTKKIKQSTKT